eukprot:UN12071
MVTETTTPRNVILNSLRKSDSSYLNKSHSLSRSGTERTNLEVDFPSNWNGGSNIISTPLLNAIPTPPLKSLKKYRPDVNNKESPEKKLKKESPTKFHR